jgi:lysophospholipase L1-like esterase
MDAVRTFMAALLALASQDALPGARPVPKEGPWLDRHKGFAEEARRGGIDVLFLGDSITDAWRTTGRKVWDEHFAPLQAANFGISGDRTQHVLWRLQNGEFDGIRPKVVVLMIGTNNIGQRNPEPPASAIKGIKAIVREIHARSPSTRVLLLGVFPRGEKPDHPHRAQIREINEAVARLDGRRRQDRAVPGYRRNVPAARRHDLQGDHARLPASLGEGLSPLGGRDPRAAAGARRQVTSRCSPFLGPADISVFRPAQRNPAPL